MPLKLGLPQLFEGCVQRFPGVNSISKYRANSGITRRSYSHNAKNRNKSHTQANKRTSTIIYKRARNKSHKARIRAFQARIHQCNLKTLEESEDEETESVSDRVYVTNQVNKSRRARFRKLQARIHQRACKVSKNPEKKNMLVWDGLFVGNQDDAGSLKRWNISRVFYLDRKTIIMQPHDDNVQSHPPQLTFYEAYDYDENNFIKEFETLSRIMRVEVLLDNNVLIYCAHSPSRDEYSRVRALVIAYMIYIGDINAQCIQQFDPKPFKDINKDHEEQLRVWGAMNGEDGEVEKIMVYEGWKDDKEHGRNWSGLKESKKLLRDRPVPNWMSELGANGRYPVALCPKWNRDRHNRALGFDIHVPW